MCASGARTPAGAWKLELDIQAVTFTAKRPQYRYSGASTALATGVWVLSDIDPMVGLVGLAGAADAAEVRDAYVSFLLARVTGESESAVALEAGRMGWWDLDVATGTGDLADRAARGR